MCNGFHKLKNAMQETDIYESDSGDTGGFSITDSIM
jgi:hypothetical protein